MKFIKRYYVDTRILKSAWSQNLCWSTAWSVDDYESVAWASNRYVSSFFDHSDIYGDSDYKRTFYE